MESSEVLLKVIRRAYSNGDDQYDVELAGSRTRQCVSHSEAIVHKISLGNSLRNMGYKKTHEVEAPLGGLLELWERL